ncbi:DUF6266 family protein [Pedobacter ginsengisoli]|uniref:DUF6266 family protein n=1 Tax=Pedobacter ginsengisoli TaxID=363852 RepID=UPI002549C333|nr:DUF6266 family protein [Pedobacter ginsengisoli]
MSRLKSGLYGPLVGKLGNVIHYVWRGMNVSRMVSHKTNIPATIPQLASRKKFTMAQKFVAPIGDFISYSFHPATKGKTKFPQNEASSLFRKHAIMGEYPDYYTDYSKVIMSKGDLPAPVNAGVSRSGDLLIFTWETNPNWNYKLKSDQVMLMAYLPDTMNAFFNVGGARRTAGTDVLEFHPQPGTQDWIKRDTVVETYLAFISNDRQQVSDSVYTGQIILHP